ncbi:MAG: DOPA 4,5-dioxygenase family protein [Pseudomonadota bacterium]
MAEEITAQDFHAHVYFSQETMAQAEALCREAAERFGVTMGRMHTQPVGPHPAWSCQLAFPPEVFGEVIPWLAINRDGLTIFVHPNTGDELADHVRHAIWMGQLLPLNLAIFAPDDDD